MFHDVTKPKNDKLDKAFEQWQNAEGRFAAALKEFAKDGQPKKVTRSAALQLGELRGVADSKMGIFFKKAVDN